MYLTILKWIIGFLMIYIPSLSVVNNGGEFNSPIEVIILLLGIYIFPLTRWGFFIGWNIFLASNDVDISDDSSEKYMNGKEKCHLCNKPISKYITVNSCTFYDNFNFQKFSRPKYLFCEDCVSNLKDVYGPLFYTLKEYNPIKLDKGYFWVELKSPAKEDLKNLNIVKDKIKNQKNIQKKRKIEFEKEKEAEKNREKRRINTLKKKIIKFLKEKTLKMPVSDIDAHLKHQNVDEIKAFCEDMYHDGEINRTANYRYFVLTEEKEKSKKTAAPKSEAVDVEKELEKLKGLLDKGLITQEQYDSKSNKLLGL